jgi:tetrahydromethanopterin S-methyltransferase subunit G
MPKPPTKVTKGEDYIYDHYHHCTCGNCGKYADKSLDILSRSITTAVTLWDEEVPFHICEDCLDEVFSRNGKKIRMIRMAKRFVSVTRNFDKSRPPGGRIFLWGEYCIEMDRAGGPALGIPACTRRGVATLYERTFPEEDIDSLLKIWVEDMTKHLKKYGVTLEFIDAAKEVKKEVKMSELFNKTKEFTVKTVTDIRFAYGIVVGLILYIFKEDIVNAFNKCKEKIAGLCNRLTTKKQQEVNLESEGV